LLARPVRDEGSLRIYKTKAFARFARKANVTDRDLCKAIDDAERGLVDADLGGGIIKLRIARRGGGKSGGFRTMVVFRVSDRAIFVLGFAKRDQDNVLDDELTMLKKLAAELLGYDAAEFAHAWRRMS
jgi:hypothetical protein